MIIAQRVGKVNAAGSKYFSAFFVKNQQKYTRTPARYRGKQSAEDHLFDRAEQLVIGLIRRNVGIVLFDLFGALEQKARLARLDHAEVVVAVAGGDRLEADGLHFPFSVLFSIYKSTFKY